MERERLRPTVLRVTLHAYELAALTAAARHVVETAPQQEAPEAARGQLRDLLAEYDAKLRELSGTAVPENRSDQAPGVR